MAGEQTILFVFNPPFLYFLISSLVCEQTLLVCEQEIESKKGEQL